MGYLTLEQVCGLEEKAPSTVVENVKRHFVEWIRGVSKKEVFQTRCGNYRVLCQELSDRANQAQEDYVGINEKTATPMQVWFREKRKKDYEHYKQQYYKNLLDYYWLVTGRKSN